MHISYKSSFHLALIAVLVAGSFSLLVTTASAATACTFSRDLQLGVMGEDVRCLQQYLNANGYTISTTGAGAPGKETGEFKTLTQTAVIKWQQANKLAPATGYFGPRSRQAYNALTHGGTVTPTPTTPSNTGNAAQDALLKQIAELQQKMKDQTKTTPVASSVAGELKSVTTALRDAEEEVADNDDADDYDDAVDSLVEARDYYYRAVLAYISGDTNEANDYLDDVDGYIEDALDSVGASSDSKEAEKSLDKVKDKLSDAEDEVDQADEDGKATSKSEDLLDEASDVIDEAETALDDEDYDEVLDLVDDAEDLISDALDAIGSNGNSDIDEMLDDARDKLDDVRDDVDSAEEDGDDMDDANDYLDDAKDLLDDAENAIDDGDDDEPEDLIDDALDLIKDAEDEL